MTVQPVRAEPRHGGGEQATPCPPAPADTPDMSVEEFEELARRAPETVTLEYINADRDTDSLTVHSEPDGDTHRLCRSHEYGDEVALPSPVDITLDTEKLKDHAG